MSKDSEKKAEDLMKDLDSTPKAAKKSVGPATLDEFLAEKPQGKYVENLLRGTVATERHSMNEWEKIVEATMSREITSD